MHLQGRAQHHHHQHLKFQQSLRLQHPQSSLKLDKQLLSLLQALLRTRQVVVGVVVVGAAKLASLLVLLLASSPSLLLLGEFTSSFDNASGGLWRKSSDGTPLSIHSCRAKPKAK